jgi:hypothetical protein
MKILFTSPVHPAKKSGPNVYVSNIFSQIRKKSKSELIWVVYEPDKIEESSDELEHVSDIRSYIDAVDLLDTIKPDCVLALNNKYESIQHSISIASKFRKIPLIHFKLIEKAEDSIVVNKKIKGLPEKTVKNLKRFFSDKTVSDTGKEKFMKNGSFILYKHDFLYKTRSKIGINFFNNIQQYFDDISSYFWHKERMQTIADLQLVNNEQWKNYFKSLGFKDEKLVLTGSPYWDLIYEKIKNRNFGIIDYQNKKINILIITAPLVEHGYGNYQQRNMLLKNIFNELKKENVSFSLKIHPSSETKISYQNLLNELNLKIPIFQEEKLWDVIENYDVVLTYGYGYPQIECAYAGIRTILLKLKWDFPVIPLVKVAIKSGYFVACQNFDGIIPSLHELLNKKIELNEEIVKERENHSYKFDGKGGERAADAIMNLLKINPYKI